jgi:hypothetical protein
MPLLQGLLTLPILQDNESWADSILPCTTWGGAVEEEIQGEAEKGVEAVAEEEDQPQHHLPSTLQLQLLQLPMSDLWEPYQPYSPVTEPKHETF